MIDVFTKCCVAVPPRNQTAETLADSFTNHWILHLGAPHKLFSDQGTAFESALFQNMCLMWRISKTRTTPYHPQGNGVCERVNGTLIHGLARLQAVHKGADWDLLLQRVVFAYNTAVHSITGFTPHRLMFGEDCRFPVHLKVDDTVPETSPASRAKEMLHSLSQACAAVRENMETKHKARKSFYDLGATARHFHVGDKVRVHLKSMGRRKGKLDAAWSDPLEILELKGAVLTLGNPVSHKIIKIHSDKTVLLNPWAPS